MANKKIAGWGRLCLDSRLVPQMWVPKIQRFHPGNKSPRGSSLKWDSRGGHFEMSALRFSSDTGYRCERCRIHCAPLERSSGRIVHRAASTCAE